MLDRGGDGAADRRLWLRRTTEDTIELIAEPAWEERDRLVGQVLALNDDLIATRRSVARRQRELELARQHASEAVDRTRRLEAILMAGLAPGGFDDALRSLMRTAEGMLPGNRADLLLLNEDDELEMRASVGSGEPGHRAGPIRSGAGSLGRGPTPAGAHRHHRRERARLRPGRLLDRALPAAPTRAR